MPTILIVEDNESSRDALARRLSHRSYSVLTAVDGQQAVKVAQHARPDLILMDVGMPGMDGWDATAALKMAFETRHIPIIVLSAHAMPSDRHQVLAAAGDDCDTKPVQFDRLIGKIEALLTAHNGLPIRL